MQLKCLKQVIFMLLMGTVFITAFTDSINAQNPENRRRENKDKKKDDKKEESENPTLMQEWFSSPESRKKILEEKARKAQQEKERKKEELERAKRRERRERRRDRRQNSIFDDESCDELSDPAETESSYVPKVTYANLYKKLQATFVKRENYLQLQNRLMLLEYQKEYSARLQSDNSLLKEWKSSAKNQSKDYRYVSRGKTYKTSRAGTEMIYRAINHGYERGIMSGRIDIKDNWGYDPENSYVYQDAIYGYDGYDIDLEEYRFYFQQGFWRGYEDGFYKRFVYGRQENGKFVMSEMVMPKIVEFKS